MWKQKIIARWSKYFLKSRQPDFEELSPYISPDIVIDAHVTNATMKPVYLLGIPAVFKLVCDSIPYVSDDSESIVSSSCTSFVIGIMSSVTSQDFITLKLS